MNTQETNVAGNYFDKFRSEKSIVKWVMRGFKQGLQELIQDIEYENLLEVGCGEGYVLELVKPGSSIGLDIDFDILFQARERYPATRYILGDAARLPFPSKSFDLLLGIEVMEHLYSPTDFLSEANRVCRNYCILSVPREPLWRVLNIARGKYLAELGNTPGHIQHWSQRSYTHFLSQHLNVIKVKHPLPWTMALCRVSQ